MSGGSPQVRVLVTDGDNRSSLAIVRALGGAGHWVAVGSPNPVALAQTSRFCAHRARYSDPAIDEGTFLQDVQRLVATLDIDVLLPATDITTFILTRHRHLFGHRCQMPFASADVILRAADKVDVLKTAMALGVPVPRSVFVSTRAELPSVIPLPFPVVIKPHRSRIKTPAGWKGTSVSYARDAQDLAAQVAERRDEEFPLALQERIAGPGLGVFLCYDRGAVVGRFCHRRLREKPPTGGVSVLCESIEMSPVALTHAEALLRELGWQGVAMVEFKVDQRDGLPKLMEINGRFWGSLQLAIDAGVDFPNILVSTLNGQTPAVAPPYRVGVRNRWLLGDFDSLMIRLFGKGQLPVREGLGGKLGAIGEFLVLFARDLYYENPKMGDLGPFRHELKTWLMGES